VDLQLTEEQRWLAESVEELVTREPAGRLWPALVEFGALEVGGDGGLGAVGLTLVARGLGAKLAAVPYAESAAVQFALGGEPACVAPCLSEPGRRFGPADPATAFANGRVVGEKDTVAYAGTVDAFAVPAASPEGVVLAVVAREATDIEPEATLDPTLEPALVRFDCAPERVLDDRPALDVLAAVAGVLVSAESVGAAGAALDLAREYASQRRQFGHTIGSFQAVRHTLADMYVKVESAWSSVLYAAATLDERDPDSLRTASIAKAYSARATRDVAHNALQVFGGIAFTAEHPAHRFLRRIVARGGHYGAAGEHERNLGRALARQLEVVT
jgi:alkylation response protein AidB-like acyl-CoA dehydrogenase